MQARLSIPSPAGLRAGRIGRPGLRGAAACTLAPVKPRRVLRATIVCGVGVSDPQQWEAEVLKADLPVVVFFSNSTFGDEKDKSRSWSAELAYNNVEFAYPGVKMAKVANFSYTGEPTLGAKLGIFKDQEVGLVLFKSGSEVAGSRRPLSWFFEQDPKPLLPFLGKPGSQVFEGRLKAYLAEFLKGQEAAEPAGGRPDLAEAKAKRAAEEERVRLYNENLRKAFSPLNIFKSLFGGKNQ